MAGKTPPFQLMYDLAVTARDKAYSAIGMALSNEKQARQQQQMLEQYKLDYTESLHEKMRTGISSPEIQNTERFIRTLDDAILRQQSVVRAMGDRLEKAREQWRLQDRQVKSMSALLARAKLKSQAIAAVREQKNNDEYAARAHARNQNNYS